MTPPRVTGIDLRRAAGSVAVMARSRNLRPTRPWRAGQNCKAVLGRGLGHATFAPLPKFARANFDLPSRGRFAPCRGRKPTSRRLACRAEAAHLEHTEARQERRP